MDNKRWQRRSEIRLRCPCRTLDGIPLEIELLDLSERGCLARSIGFPLHFGQALRLFPEGCDAFTAIVRRSQDEICGIEFDKELPTPVFERMRCYAPEPEETAREAEIVVDEPATPSTAAAPSVRATPAGYGSLLNTVRKAPATKRAIF
jgi:hypothetical protein